MAAKKFLRNVAGRITEIIATVTSSGVGNDGDIVALDTSGKLDVSVLPVGVGPDVKIHPSSENLVSGDWVNIWNDAGTLKVRKADATATGKEADGFVLANVTSPADATVHFDGINTALGSLTLGAQYFLSTTPGVGVATTPPSASGNIVQRLGKAISLTEIESDLGNVGILVA
jgi:hypothetical protein